MKAPYVITLTLLNVVLGVYTHIGTGGNTYLTVAVIAGGTMFTMGVMAICGCIRDSLPQR